MLFDLIVTDNGLRRVCRSLFVDGHYDIAVERAYIYVNNMVKKKTPFADKDGAALMQEVFSANDPVSQAQRIPIPVRQERTARLHGHLCRIYDRDQEPAVRMSTTLMIVQKTPLKGWC